MINSLQRQFVFAPASGFARAMPDKTPDEKLGFYSQQLAAEKSPGQAQWVHNIDSAILRETLVTFLILLTIWNPVLFTSKHGSGLSRSRQDQTGRAFSGRRCRAIRKTIAA
jgi:hypothetical protein